MAAAVVVRVAAKPTWAADDPVASDTPGYPKSVHADDEMFVNTMGTYVDPAAPPEAPTVTRRSWVVHPAVPPAAGEVDPAARGDAADDETADEGEDAAGADDADEADEAAADDTATEEEPAADDEDDEDDGPHPATAATAAPTAITPRARSSRAAKPAITNHSF